MQASLVSLRFFEPPINSVQLITTMFTAADEMKNICDGDSREAAAVHDVEFE